MRAKGPSPVPRHLIVVKNTTPVVQHHHLVRSISTQARPARRVFTPAFALSQSSVQFFPRGDLAHQLPRQNLSHEIPSMLRFFSHYALVPESNTTLDLSSNRGLQWLYAQQEKGNFNFGLVLQQKLQLRAQDIVVGFRVQRDYSKFAQTDVFYLIDPANAVRFKQFWESVLAPIQITRQSTIDLYHVNKAHQVWSDQIATKHGHLTRVLIGVDFVDHEYALMSKLSTQQTLAYIKEHAEKFKVCSETGELNHPVMMPLNVRPK